VLGPRLRRGPNTCPGTACSPIPRSALASPASVSPNVRAPRPAPPGVALTPAPHLRAPRPASVSPNVRAPRPASPGVALPPAPRLPPARVVQPFDRVAVASLRGRWRGRPVRSGCAVVRPCGGRFAAWAVAGEACAVGLCSRSTVWRSPGCATMLGARTGPGQTPSAATPRPDAASSSRLRAHPLRARHLGSTTGWTPGRRRRTTAERQHRCATVLGRCPRTVRPSEQSWCQP